MDSMSVPSASQSGSTARRKTREALLDAMGRLLETKGLDFSLPELAAESGVATATVYRHFEDQIALRAEFYNRIFDRVMSEIGSVSADLEPLDQFYAICRVWASLERDWARAASYIRSAEGYLERLRRQEPLTTELYRLLAPVLERLIDLDLIPSQDLEYATLMWITVFDERVFIDLQSVLGWSPDEVAVRLGASLLACLSVDVGNVQPTAASPSVIACEGSKDN
jgi:AcrR family transcriptional regulator